ncbi:hypothetical protein LCGC14_2311250, partial [marine sediment metagenome]
MSTLGMFGKVAAGYLKAAEASRDEQTAAEKEQRQVATSILMKMVDDPSTRPETIKWALGNLTNIAGGKWKGKLDISQIPTGQADPGQPPELGQMAAPAGQPQPQQRQVPTPPPPTGAQYLTPMSQGEQLRQKTDALMSVLEEAGVDEPTRQAALVQMTTGLRPPTIPTPPKPPAPRPEGWEVIEQNGVITGVRSRDKAGPSFLRDDSAKPEEAQQFLDAAVAARATALEEEMLRDVRKSALVIERTEARIHAQGRERDRQTALKLADSARGSDLLVGKMEAILRDIEATGGVITGPQVMALLSFHMSMTIGDLKGGRASWPIIEKHLGSRAWPETFRTFVKGIRARKGEAGLISIEQAREWVELAQKRRQLDWSVTKESILSRNLNPADFRIPADVLGD